MAHQTFPEPPAVGSEADTLVGSLERQRATFAWKCAGLDRAGLNVRLGRSAVTLAGLLKHLAYMEDLNFTRDLGGQELPAGWPSSDAGDWAWQSAADDTTESLHTLWAEAVARSRRVVSDTLRTGAPDQQYVSLNGGSFTVRRLLVREAVDGRVGEDPPGHPYPFHL
jgi:hypothetical protein